MHSITPLKCNLQQRIFWREECCCGIRERWRRQIVISTRQPLQSPAMTPSRTYGERECILQNADWIKHCGLQTAPSRACRMSHLRSLLEQQLTKRLETSTP